MIFSKTKLSDACIIEIEKIEDERGFFARIWDKEKFLENGIGSEFLQSSISLSKKKGTIRGMHYQTKPFEESKIVRCTRGSIFDVIIDLRADSKTFKEWFGIELSENNYRCMYIPKGFAHGFQTLENDSEVSYQISETYKPEYSKGIRWNDKFFEIKWPLIPTIMSKKDEKFPKFNINNI
jgi:dTDP-4-dehydrorhamnose 3,5-epimerase|tara:strand:- start:1681 stop:2220 length:540 start_codon:yes stop_codon:yes gene_type:complete